MNSQGCPFRTRTRTRSRSCSRVRTRIRVGPWRSRAGARACRNGLCNRILGTARCFHATRSRGKAAVRACVRTYVRTVVYVVPRRVVKSGAARFRNRTVVLHKRATPPLS